MPDPTFVPGSLGTITFNVVPIITGQASNFNRSRNAQAKPVIGSPDGFAIGGQRTGTFSVNGHVSAEQLPQLETAFALGTSIAFAIQVGDPAGATDSGSYAGSCVFNNLNIAVAGEGEWTYAVECITTGAVVYTPPA